MGSESQAGSNLYGPQRLGLTQGDTTWSQTVWTQSPLALALPVSPVVRYPRAGRLGKMGPGVMGTRVCRVSSWACPEQQQEGAASWEEAREAQLTDLCGWYLPTLPVESGPSSGSQCRPTCWCCWSAERQKQVLDSQSLGFKSQT